MSHRTLARPSRWVRKSLVSALLLVVILTLAVGPALATASSGRIYKGTVNGYRVCTESVIRDVADNVAYTSTWDFTSCNTPRPIPAGWIGAAAVGYRDGSYCGSTGMLYSSVYTYQFGVGSHLCSNPGGYQSFHTVASSQIWNGQFYVQFTIVTSPSQSY